MDKLSKVIDAINDELKAIDKEIISLEIHSQEWFDLRNQRGILRRAIDNLWEKSLLKKEYSHKLEMLERHFKYCKACCFDTKINASIECLEASNIGAELDLLAAKMFD